MLPFGVTIPATVPQRSEIPEGLMNYPVFSLYKDIECTSCDIQTFHPHSDFQHICYSSPRLSMSIIKCDLRFGYSCQDSYISTVCFTARSFMSSGLLRLHMWSFTYVRNSTIPFANIFYCSYWEGLVKFRRE